MITYNHASFIAQAIEGVLMQKCNFPIELIIGEDCSTDKTRQICEQYGEKFSEIKLLPSNSNLGVSCNFIRTLQACTGKYIAFCEGDDYWTDPYKLQKQVDFFEANPEYGLVHTCFEVRDLNNNFITTISKERPSGYIFIELQKECIVSTLTTMLRGEIANKLADRIAKENLWFIMDHWLWKQCAIKWKIHYLPDITAVYHVHPGGISNNKKYFKLRDPLITLDVINSFLNENDQNINFGNKLLIATNFFRSYFAVLCHPDGKPFRQGAVLLLRKNKWLLIGAVPAVGYKIKSRLKL
jgi:glycosyltransferase involved in cell wall biosynthesis